MPTWLSVTTHCWRRFSGWLYVSRTQSPVKAAARLLNEHDTRLWRIVHHYVEEARDRADFSAVRQVGVDETASKRGHNYITLFVDLDESRLLFATEGRHAATLGTFREDLEAHGASAEAIEEFCLDMSPAYLKGLDQFFPTARLTFDKFHVMKLINEAVDEVRRQEQRVRPELKGSRYVWVKNPEQLTMKQIEISDRLRLPRLHLKTVRAYHLRLAFQDFWNAPRRRAGLDETRRSTQAGYRRIARGRTQGISGISFGAGLLHRRCRVLRAPAVPEDGQRDLAPAEVECLVAAPHVEVDPASLDFRAGVEDGVDAAETFRDAFDVNDGALGQQGRVGGRDTGPDGHA